MPIILAAAKNAKTIKIHLPSLIKPTSPNPL
jgi:hypothetical protein